MQSVSNNFMISKRSDLGAAFIEMLIILPVLLVIIWLVFAFIGYVNNYTLLSQAIREGANDGAVFVNVSDCVGLCDSQCFCFKGDCPENCGAGSGYTCDGTDPLHDKECAHGTTRYKVGQLYHIYGIDKFDNVSITTTVTSVGAQGGGTSDIFFEVNMKGKYESGLDIFGDKSINISAKSYVRTLP